MKDRKEIEKIVLEGNQLLDNFSAKNGVLIAACLEVLLDIRDLLEHPLIEINGELIDLNRTNQS